MSHPAVTGCILAGGRATRWGGQDKGLLMFATRPMVAHVVERFAPQVDHLIINANRNLDAYRSFGWPVISDEEEGYLGPLAGLASALGEAQDPWVATVPCDSPLLPVDLVRRLCATARDSGANVVIVDDGERLQPVFALVKATLLPALRRYLQSGERKIMTWFNRQNLAAADFSDCQEAFENINRPQDRARLEAILEKGAR